MSSKLKTRWPRTVGILISIIVLATVTVYVNPCSVMAQSTGGPLDYVIIYHESLVGTALNQLLALKAAQGYSYHAHRIGDGDTKWTIRWIAMSRYHSSEYAPSYVLLVGSAKRDGGVNDSISDASVNNLIPTHYEVDEFGHLTAYDQWFAYMTTNDEESELPRIIIGRIPARDTVELQNYVDKLVAYNADTGDETWKRNILFVAGDKDRGPFPGFPSPAAVRNNIDYHYNSIPTSFTGSKMDYADGDQAFINAVNSGVGLIAGLTTGSHANNFGYIIQRPSFDAETDLSNTGQYPVFLASSCNLGQIDVDDGQGGQCLAENLLLSPSCGVIGIIGPAGFSSDYTNSYYLSEAFNRLFNKGVTRIGDLNFAVGRIQRYNHRGQRDTYNMTTVLGDPGLQIPSRYFGLTDMIIDAKMEMTDAVPYQDRPHYLGTGIENTKAGIVKRDHIYGRRSYRIEGDDTYESDPTAYWTLYDNLGLVLDENTRFLTYYVKALEGMTTSGLGFSVECIVDDNLLSSYDIVDQNGLSINPVMRAEPSDEVKYYVFDLEDVSGKTLEKVLVGYGCVNWKFDGHFAAIFDDIRISATWGLPPAVGELQMPTNIIEGGSADVSISAEDPDTLLYGDELSIEWSVTDGTITGSGFDVVYDAPSYPVSGLEITATVSDEGGHEIISSKTFNVVEDTDPTCPHLFVWDGKKYVDQGAFLTRSRIERDKTSVFDAHPFFTKPAPTNGKLKFVLREEGNDITDLRNVSMNLVSLGPRAASTAGITGDGKIMSISNPIAPVRCYDDQQFDQTNKVLRADGRVFRAYGPGYLVLQYHNLPPPQLPKPGGSHAGGEGGPGLPPPGKNMDKIVAGAADPDNPNYVSVTVNLPDGGWKEIERLAPKSTVRLPRLIDLLPYVDSKGSLRVQIAWTSNFSVDDLSFYTFSDSDITETQSTLSVATHNSLGTVTDRLSDDNVQSATLEPGEEIILEFDWPAKMEKYNFGVMKFHGKYEPFLAPDGGQTDTELGFDSDEVILHQNVPNPFNTHTRIAFTLPHEGWANLAIYNILGQKVCLIANEFLSVGNHEFTWDGNDYNGKPVPSGVYFYTLSFEGSFGSKKMIVLK